MTSIQSLKIAISAGELSGDEHASEVVKALRAAHPKVVLRGMGGRHMRAAGAETIVDSETEASVMGFTEVIGSLGKIFGALKKLKMLLKNWKPDLLVVVDFPDFHFLLMRYAKKLGIPVLYYITPSVWAWRSGRVRTIRKYVDRAAVIYPFEREFLEKRKFEKAVYVGNPLAETFQKSKLSESQKREFLERCGVPDGANAIALLPGSRSRELKEHLGPILGGAAKFLDKHPHFYGLIPVATSVSMAEVKEVAPKHDRFIFLEGTSLEVMQCCRAGILKSGTSNLQAAFCGLPFSMFYIASPLSTFIVKHFIPIDQYSIVNIIKRSSVRELILEAANADTVASELEKLTFDEKHRKQVLDDLKSVSDQLLDFDLHSGFQQGSTCGERVAQLALEMVP